LRSPNLTHEMVGLTYGKFVKEKFGTSQLGFVIYGDIPLYPTEL